MTDIAQEIEKLADKYRSERKTENKDEKGGGDKKFTLDDFVNNDKSGDVFDENYLSNLETQIEEISDEDEEMKVEDFIKLDKKNIEAKSENLLDKNNLKPKNKAASLTNNILRNLRELKALMRS